MREHDEIRLARAVSAFFRKQLDRVLVKPRWAWEDSLLTLIIEPILTGIARAEAIRETRRMLKSRQDPGLFDRVLTWAKDYTYKLVKGINENTRRRLAVAISEFVETEETMGTLREAVSGIFSPERANLIAVTEVTRSYSEGGSAAADELREAGFTIIERWRTAMSGVCDECKALEGEDISKHGNIRPPLHPGCRCKVTREIA